MGKMTEMIQELRQRKAALREFLDIKDKEFIQLLQEGVLEMN